MAQSLEARPSSDKRKVSFYNAYLSGDEAIIKRNRKARGEGRRKEPVFLKKRLELDWESLKGFLNVTGVEDIHSLAADTARLARTKETANNLIAEQLGIKTEASEGIETEASEGIETKLERYARLADSTVDYVQRDLRPWFSRDGRNSDVRGIHHPVDLLIAAFTLPDPIDRFRALRKFRLIQTAAKIEGEERRLGTDAACKKFEDFVDTKVFDPISADDPKYFLLSQHDPEDPDFKTVSEPLIKTADQLEESGIDVRTNFGLRSGQKLLPLQLRTFTTDQNKTVEAFIPAQSEGSPVRKKPLESMMIKVWRKNTTVAKAVADQLGMMIMFRNVDDMDAFNKRLIRTAIDEGSALEFETPEYTVEGGGRNQRTEGGSPNLRMFKSHLLMFGIRPEYVGLTPANAADYYYGEFAHRRYELKRLLRNVIPRFAPPNLYNYDPDIEYEWATTKVENEIQNPYMMEGLRAA